ncbi:WD40 domain-containing protein [Anabaena azotica]|uniref:AAA family ATPase n=1 Tax=Anabaena azotica FACHB-119 TaxID=947527 RepID=A0ABR8D307_9NOST|nr:NB-ARC domain-containing protein [Anabaena azotica]MBD2501579.1 AAA family ATPase [Anabaena azotica FACHB-119]
MIYTFYSYKGGTGRSMALANIAKLLYEYGLKVLMIDFDLEAPGLERFFLNSSSYNHGKWQEKCGVIDLLNRYKKFFALYNMGFSQDKESKRLSNVAEKFFANPQSLDDFIINVDHPSDAGGTLSFIPSGCRNEFIEYAASVRAFDFDDFYINQQGNNFFEQLIKNLKARADVILIDSRTGITEMGGVCTHHLADVVVMFVTTQDQSIYGVHKVAKSLTNPELIKKRDNRKISLIFVPSRVNIFEKESLDAFQDEFENLFGIEQEVFNNSLLKFRERAFIDLKIPYIAYYDYKEKLAVEENRKASSADLRKAYKNLAYTLSQLAPREHPLHQKFSEDANKISTQEQVSHPIAKQDWERAPDTSRFFGREKEIETLRKWIIEERCRIVAILGMGGIGKTDLSLRLSRGGIGKTDLSLKLAREITEQFDYVIWRSLREGRLLKDILPEIIRFLSQEIDFSNEINSQIQILLNLLNKYRCLLIFDNAESILKKGEHRGKYDKEYENYGTLFRKIGEIKHQSCLMITSREKHPEIAELEVVNSYVRSLHLNGLNEMAGKQLMQFIANSRFESLTGTEEEWKEIIEFYNGNPLALKLATNYIIDVCSGNIAEFFQTGKTIFETIHQLLDWHFEQLSDDEKDVMYWLAINQKGVSILELKDDILSPIAQQKVDFILQSLQNQLSIQKGKIQKIIPQAKVSSEETKVIEARDVSVFSLHPVIMEYMIERLVSQVTEELKTGDINFFNNYALLKATTGEYVRDIQRRLILEPIQKRLINIFGSASNLEKRLEEIIKKLQTESPLKPGYAGGNLVNFIYNLTGNLNGRNFSSLAIRQAYLQGVELKGTNFSGADITNSIFTNKLSHVLAVALSPHGNAVATGDSSGEICVWNVTDGHLLQKFKDHKNWVWSVKFSPPDGHKLASASDDKTVKIWDVKTGEHLKTLTELLEEEQSHDDWVRCVAFDKDGLLLASGSDDATIKLWDIKTGSFIRTLTGHQMRVWSLAFSPCSNSLVSGSDDKKVILWDTEIGKPIKVFTDHEERVQAVAFNRDGQLIASGSADATVRIFDCLNHKCLKILKLGESRIWGLAFSPNDDRKLAVASDDAVLRIYDIDTLEPFRTFIGHKSRIRSVAFTLDGSKLASGSEDKTVKIWHVQEGKCLQTFEGQTDRVWSVAFSNDGKYLVNGSEDQKVRLWDLRSDSETQYSCIKEFLEQSYWVWSVTFHPSDSSIIATGSDEKIVKIWNVETGTLLKKLEGHKNWILSVAFSPDGKTLASGSEDTTIKIWDINAEECLETLETRNNFHEGHKDRVRSVAFHPHGNFLASGSDDKKIIIWQWNGQTGKFVQHLEVHKGRVRAVAFSANGEYLASSSDDKTIKIWKVNTDKKFEVIDFHLLKGHKDKVVSVAFSPDSKILASGSDDTTVRLWDVQTGKCLKVLRGHNKWVRSVAFRNDGILASSSQDETIKLWNLETFDCYQTLKADGPYQGMNITKIMGLTETEISTLKALGAVDDILPEQEYSIEV